MTGGFFQTHARLTGKSAGAAPPAEAMTVTQLTRQIEKAIKSGVPAIVSVKGEVSNFRPQKTGSGHLYFTLKDSAACIDCVMWNDAARVLKFTVADGLELLASGRVGVYADRGKYQLYVNTLAPLGQGALELAFKQLRDTLERQGLFAAERKKPLPRYPQRIVLLTSSATAALQDMLKVLRRFPWLSLVLYHVPVQGDGAAGKIAAGLKAVNQMPGIDAILLGRGGGSIEDLWAFNEEVVARAIATSRIPIVTGIGHEVDVTIADLVADHHAHTPTEAAQTITAHWRTAHDRLGQIGSLLRTTLRQYVQSCRQRLTAVQRHELFRRPTQRINDLRQLLDDRQKALSLAVAAALRRRTATLASLDSRLAHHHPRHEIALSSARLDACAVSLRRAGAEGLRRRGERLAAIAGHLDAVGPEQVLRRGYSITTRKKDSRPLRSAAEVKPGDALVTRMADGTIESTVDDARQPRLF